MWIHSTLDRKSPTPRGFLERHAIRSMILEEIIHWMIWRKKEILE